MPSQSPRYIMRNANLFIDRENYVGQASEIGFGKLERKMEEVFNGGQEMPIEVPMGYEMPENSFKMTGLDPTVLKLFGLAVGVETEVMAVGALVNDTGETSSATAFMRVLFKSTTLDAHTRGDKTEVEYELSIRHYKLEIDGQPIVEVDPFEVKIGGVSQTGDIRSALLIT